MKVDFAVFSRARERRDRDQLHSLRIARPGPRTSRAEVTRRAATWAFLELAGGTTADAVEAEVVSRTAARGPPPTRAGGQDDGSYTNSLKLLPPNTPE